VKPPVTSGHKGLSDATAPALQAPCHPNFERIDLVTKET